jgi:hypothetical protein
MSYPDGTHNHMLTAETLSLWAEYLASEKNCVRGATMQALERFINVLLSSARPDWIAWGKSLAAEVSDRGLATPVRLPLFRRVLLPALVEGVLAGEPGCARWLASFASLLDKCRDTGLPPHLQSVVGLMEEALRVDSSDSRVRRSLVEHHANYLRYTLHEIPSGVLYGTDGATLDECGELQKLLAEFREHVRLTGQGDRFKGLLEDCELHFHAYATYLRQPSPRSGYASYLDALEMNDADGSAP